jgi:hypothetical protein
MKRFLPSKNPLARLFQLHLRRLYLLGWQWVEQEQCGSHPDAPTRVIRMQQLRDEIALLQNAIDKSVAAQTVRT